MKNLAAFRLRDATLAFALVATSVLAAAQDGSGNKPEMMAPMHEMAHGQMQDKAKVPSTSLAVSFGEKNLTLSPSDLSAVPHESVTVTNGHTKAKEIYTGVPIAALLAKLGVPFEKSNEHTLLKTSVLAEGTDGYKVLVSVYETLSAIRGQDAIVADTVDGKPLGKDGAFKLVIPGDSRPQRWVQNLKSLSFKTMD